MKKAFTQPENTFIPTSNKILNIIIAELNVFSVRVFCPTIKSKKSLIILFEFLLNKNTNKYDSNNQTVITLNGHQLAR